MTAAAWPCYKPADVSEHVGAGLSMSESNQRQATRSCPATALPATPPGYLPPQMRVLFVTGLHRTGGWLAEAFAADGVSEIMLDEAVGIARGMSMLRDEVYDAVLVSHEGEGLNALELLDAIRAGSRDTQPILVLGDIAAPEMAAMCYEAGGDAYLCVEVTTTRALIWELARACERHQLLSENRRLRRAEGRRLQLERDEASSLLAQQRQLLSPEMRGQAAETALQVPSQLIDHYRQLLRTYVIMGAGNLGGELSHLADLLAAAFVAPEHAFQLHLHVLDEMVQGLGSRSARHIMNRADCSPLNCCCTSATAIDSDWPRRPRTLPPPEPRRPPDLIEDRLQGRQRRCSCCGRFSFWPSCKD